LRVPDPGAPPPRRTALPRNTRGRSAGLRRIALESMMISVEVCKGQISRHSQAGWLRGAIPLRPVTVAVVAGRSRSASVSD
jgi:hypothetical protein